MWIEICVSAICGIQALKWYYRRTNVCIDGLILRISKFAYVFISNHNQFLQVRVDRTVLSLVKQG